MRDLAFKALCDDPTIVFSPQKLGFFPLRWSNWEQPFGDLVSRFSKEQTIRTPDSLIC
jgi:hypothetical protein